MIFRDTFRRERISSFFNPSVHHNSEGCSYQKAYMDRMELILKSLNDLEQCLSGMIDPEGGQVCPKCRSKHGHHPTCPDDVWIIK
jgi:hypothetical protein